jgi:hypothetical protein
MDFLTIFPYAGMLILIAINALVVSKMKIEIGDEE